MEEPTFHELKYVELLSKLRKKRAELNNFKEKGMNDQLIEATLIGLNWAINEMQNEIISWHYESEGSDFKNE